MIKAIAIDDEPLALEIICNHSLKVPFLSLERTFNSPVRALEYLNNNTIDLIFLDINMPDLSGFDFIKLLKRNNISIIFTTAHDEYALESYEVDAIDYLLKPFDFSRFLISLNKVKDRVFAKNKLIQDFVFLSTGYQQRKVFLNDIYLIKGEGNYVTYFTPTEKIMVRSSIKEAIHFMPDHLFVQIHRSFIVSLRHIDKIEDNHVFIEGKRISIGATYKDNLKKIAGIF